MLLLKAAFALPMCATLTEGIYEPSVVPTFDRIEPTEHAETAAKELACALMQDPSRTLHIGAHTDARGSSSYNRSLSHTRATALRALVIAAGAKPEQVTARGYGEDYPITDNRTIAGREANRRFELLATDPKRAAVEPPALPGPRPGPPTPKPADPCEPLPTPDTPCEGAQLCPVDQDSYLTCSNGEWTRITERPVRW